MKKHILPIALSLFAIAFAGLFVQEKQKTQAMEKQAQKVIDDHRALQGERDGLRTANAKLRDQLETFRRMPQTAQASPTASEALTLRVAEVESAVEEDLPLAMTVAAEVPARTRPEPSPEEIAAREQRMQEWTQRREEFRTRMITTAQDRRAFFAQVSTDGLSPEYAASHNRLLQAMEEVETLIAQGANEELPREERMALRVRTGELAGEINQLMQVEREILLSDYASSLGLRGADTDEFIKGMQTITEMTTPPRLFGGGGGRRDGRGPGGAAGGSTSVSEARGP